MSRIDSVDIKNFRGIVSCQLTKLARVNLLIGKNNAGKSSVLEAVTRALDGNQGRIDTRSRDIATIWQESRSEGRRQSNDLIHAGADAFSLSVTGTFGSAVLTAQRGPIELAPTVSSYPTPVPSIGMFFPRDATDRAVEGGLWPRLVQTRVDRELAAAVTDLFGEKVDTLQMLPNGDLIVGLEKFGIRLDGQGSGFRSALRLLMVAAATKGGILVVEEPECHQHAGSLRRLARVLTTQAKERDIQIFISTHSLECVRAFAESADPTPTGDMAWPFLTLSLERRADGTVTPRRLARETVLGLDDAGTDVRFIEDYQ